MQTESNQTVARLERLEQENHQLGRAVRRANFVAWTLAFFVIAFTCAGAMQGPGPIEARELTIIGANGKPRITLGVTEQNSAAIELYDAGGDVHLRAEADALGGECALLMRNIKDQGRITLGIDPQTDQGTLIINGLAK